MSRWIKHLGLRILLALTIWAILLTGAILLGLL